MLIELIDGSALNTALPQIAKCNNSKNNNYHIFACFGIIYPASGWISDKIGSKNLLILSITYFMLSSISIYGLSD